MKYLHRVFVIWLALLFTIAALALVGIGEARRNYYIFRVDNAILQSESLLGILRRDLDNGTSLKSISGLAKIATSLARSDDTILNVRIFGEDDSVVAENDPDFGQRIAQESFSPSRIKCSNGAYAIQESERYIHIERVIESRFGQVGRIVLTLDNQKLGRPLLDRAWEIVGAAAVLGVLLYLLMAFTAWKLSQKPLRMKRVIQLSYLVVYLAVSGVIVYGTLQVYTQAVEGKSRSLGSFLGQRIAMVPQAGISFADTSGIQELLAGFQKENREICSVEVFLDGVVRYAAIDNSISASVAQQENDSVIVQTIGLETGVGSTADEKLVLRVKVPRSVIRDAVLDGSINLLVLLFALGLVANMVLETGVIQLSASLRSDAERAQGKDALVSSDEALGAMQTAYLIMGLINSLTLPFLAPLIRDLAGGVSSLPFTVFFLCFAIPMIPAGRLAEKGYIRHLLLVSVILETLGCATVALATSLPLLTVGRGLSGFGQGIFLIGFQSFIISVTSRAERTQGQSLKVVIRYGVLMAGSALGALMIVYLDYTLVFAISAMLGLAALLYVICVVPDPKGVQIDRPQTIMLRKSDTQSSRRFGLGEVFRIFRDPEFLKALLLSGIPSKIAVAGVVMFSIPLLLQEQGITPESVGRYLMLYYVTSMVASRWSAKIADRSGRTKNLLVAAALIGGIGFTVMGAVTSGVVDVPGIENWLVVLLAASIFLGGLSNGLNAAPILTHVTKTESAKQQGSKTMVAAYSFVERFGHITGSFLITACAAALGGIGFAILVFGLASLALGLLFQASAKLK